MFKKINIVPHWVIFIIDLVVSLFALGIAYLIRYNFHFDSINIAELSRNLLLFAVINSIVFYFGGIHKGIVRYTSAQDSLRILVTLLIAGGFFFVVNLVLMATGAEPLMRNTVLIINFMASFIMLVVYRMAVKYFFLYVKNLNLDKRRVVIYGAGETGIAVKRTLDHDPNMNMHVVAFMDDDIRKRGKWVDGVKIIHSDNFESLLKHDITDLLIAISNLSAEKKTQVVDKCLEHGIKALTLPPVPGWIDGHINTSQIQNIKIEDLLEREPIEIHNEAIGDQLNGKRILVTGAAGSIGSEIVRQVAKFAPQMIIMMDQAETPLHELQLELQDGRHHNVFHCFIGDVRNRERMEELFSSLKPHYVYHAAAYKHVPLMENNPAEAIRTNVMGTRIMADLAVKYNALKFVMVSTDKAVNPTNVMGASKRIAEIYVQSLFNSFKNPDHVYCDGHSYLNSRESIKTKFITTRFGNVLGSNGSVIPRFKDQIQRGGPITVTHPEITRYFMTIPEACRLVLEAGSMGEGGEIFIFDMGKSVKIVDLAKRMIRLAGLVPNQDIYIEYSGLRPGEKLYEELLNDNENTLPTHNPKIMIGKTRVYEFEEVETHILELIKLSSVGTAREVVAKMKQMVPEFISNNSIYEDLDKKKVRPLTIVA